MRKTPYEGSEFFAQLNKLRLVACVFVTGAVLRLFSPSDTFFCCENKVVDREMFYSYDSFDRQKILHMQRFFV